MKSCVLLPAAGRRSQLFHLIFTEPGKHTLAHPCILTVYSLKCSALEIQLLEVLFWYLEELVEYFKGFWLLPPLDRFLSPNRTDLGWFLSNLAESFRTDYQVGYLIAALTVVIGHGLECLIAFAVFLRSLCFHLFPFPLPKSRCKAEMEQDLL